MGMPVQHSEWTAEMARALPDDGMRYEVLDGELFASPVPSLLHQRAVVRLMIMLANYCQANSIGETMFSPSDIEFSERRLLQPDVFVVPLIEGRRIRDWKDVSGLLLAAEVLSPSTARADRVVKRRILQDEGVPNYWVVDLDARAFDRWRPSESRPEVLVHSIEWQPVPSLAPLVIDLPAYFSSVLGSEFEALYGQTNAQEHSIAGISNVPWVVTYVAVLPRYRLLVRFVDGTEGEVDMSALVERPDAGVFTELADLAAFSKAFNNDGHVAWPTGQDLAPDAMHDEIARNGHWILR